ncbi:substrate-binding domain-containing protein [Paenibacillus antri]|uniref:Substrate-binding domain-containing protein n=1 Tax=Paenibacillus antri TaxID=2582848 RepID=A0A5R9GBY6_9BACL|nr:GntR family transcriptional regulator [Paenibacillus antri]TLS51836.1 substrate-binding domain-containing protein [Paenibacillus antri]
MKSMPLYKKIQLEIKQLIGSGVLREGDRIPSEKELADKYHVSQITSKNALNGLVEEGLLVRVQGKGTFVLTRPEYASALDRVADAGNKPGTGGTIGLIVPTMKTKVDQSFVDAIEKYASAAGFDLMLRITRESQEEETKIIDSFLKHGVEGIIIFPVENENYNDSILRLSLERFPLVLIDRFLKEIKTYSVSSDNIAGTCEAVEYLMDKGHTSIAFISPEITNTVTDERAQGFERAYLHRRISIDKSLWCLLPLDVISGGRAYEAVKEFLQGHPEVTAAITVNTELCRYVYGAATTVGKPIPEGMELITFDPPGIPDVSYIRQNEEEMCRITMELLLEQIRGKLEPQRVVVPVKLVQSNAGAINLY